MLYRLEAAGLIVGSWSEVGGRRRKSYTLTERGMAALQQKRQSWDEFSGAVSAVLAKVPGRVHLAGPLVAIEWPIEAYLRALQCKLDHRTDAIDLVSEVEDHLREAAERLLDRGYGRAEAEFIALARLGEPDLVAALLVTKAPPDPRSRLDRLRGRPIAFS